MASSEAVDLIEEILWAIPMELRVAITVISYAFIDRTAVNDVAPALVGIYDGNARAIPRRDGYGLPSARATAAILNARTAFAAKSDVPDGRFLQLYEVTRELQSRLDVIEERNHRSRNGQEKTLEQALSTIDRINVRVEATEHQITARAAS
jgi:hypothetical protein